MTSSLNQAKRSSPTLVRRRVGLIGVAAAFVLLVWAAYTWTALRPEEIVSDWHGWRQSDTQTIALNYIRPGSSILRPQISWGGDGPGYVETELQLYSRVVSGLMRLLGQKEWVGQLVSLLAMTAAGAMVFFHLSRRYHPVAAAVGLGAFLAARTSAHLATVVMPDALALLAYATAWAYFWRYAEDGRTVDLILYGLAGALAMLIKPTTAHIGISSVLLLLLWNRARLRDYRIWVTWGAMVATFGLYLGQAHHLYSEYGNTFGLLVGEDSKTPHLRYLLMPKLYWHAARYAVIWGLGPVAALALIVQALRRRLHAEHLALAAGNAIIVLIALRYMSEGQGVHYYAPASLLAAAGVASLCQDLLSNVGRTRTRYAAFAMVCLLLLAQGYRNMNVRYFNAHFFADDPTIASIVATGREIDRLTQPGDLIVVRSPNVAYDTFWQQAKNYHDPRIFYISETRGWAIGSEQDDPKLVADPANRGARFFADPLLERSPVLDVWLAANADLVWSTDGGGRIWKLHAAPAAQKVYGRL